MACPVYDIRRLSAMEPCGILQATISLSRILLHSLLLYAVPSQLNQTVAVMNIIIEFEVY